MSSPFDFAVGQMVVCIDDEWSPPDPGKRVRERDPICGMIYTIRDIGEHANGDMCLLFEEIRHGEPRGEPAYPAGAFRPVKSTNIDKLREVVAPIRGMSRAVATVVAWHLDHLDGVAWRCAGMGDEWGDPLPRALRRSSRRR